MRVVWGLLAAPASSSLLCSFTLVRLDPRTCDWHFSLLSAIGVRPPFVSTDSRSHPCKLSLHPVSEALPECTTITLSFFELVDRGQS